MMYLLWWLKPAQRILIAVWLNLKKPSWRSVIPGFEPMPLLGPTLEFKLCMV